MARKSKKSGSENGVLELDATASEAPTDAEVMTDLAEQVSEGGLFGSSEPIPPAKPAEPEPDPLWAKLVILQQQAYAAGMEAVLAAEEAKRKKKDHDAATEAVLALIRRSTKPMPLFDKPSEAGGSEDAGHEAEAVEPIVLKIAGLSDAAAEAAAAEDFKTIPIWALVDFGMPKKYVSILADGGVETIGDVKKLGDKGLDLTEVKGVGESARDKINAAMDAMWKYRGENQAQANAHHAAAFPAVDPSSDWVDPDTADDPEADRADLTDAGVPDPDHMEDEYDPTWSDEPDDNVSDADPEDDAETDVDGDPDEEDFEREDSESDEGTE